MSMKYGTIGNLDYPSTIMLNYPMALTISYYLDSTALQCYFEYCLAVYMLDC